MYERESADSRCGRRVVWVLYCSDAFHEKCFKVVLKGVYVSNKGGSDRLLRTIERRWRDAMTKKDNSLIQAQRRRSQGEEEE